VSDNSIGILSLKVVVPVPDWKDRYNRWPWMAKLEPTTENGLSKVSAADTFQVRSLSQEKFIRRLGTLSEGEMQAVIRALATVLKIK
jgi:mRNA interferase MazF